jgi:diguanylate cyclase (GGDEF)-like protein/PAS domain S-box-containing protein
MVERDTAWSASGRVLTDQFSDGVELERGAVLGLLAAGYAAWAILSILVFQFDDGQAGIWLPNVFAVAIMLRNARLGPMPAIAAVFMGCLSANLLLGATVFDSIWYSCANAATVLVEATLLVKVIGGRTPVISNARDYALMLATGGVAAPAIIAALIAALGASDRGWPPMQTFWDWIVGEGLGFAVLLPILMMAGRTAFAGLLNRATLARLAAVTCGSVLLAMAAANWAQFPFILVIVPLMVAAAFAGPLELAIACGMVGAALIGLQITGALAGLDPSNGGFAYGFQLAVAVVVVLPFIAVLILEQTRGDRRRIAESEQRFRRAMEDSAIGVAVVALDGRIVEANPAFADMLGYSRQELEALTFFQITHPDDIAIGANTMQRVRAGETNSYQFEKRYIRKDRTSVWARLSGSVIRDAETGAPLYLVSQIEDIDARKESETRIAEAETRWNFALASAGQGVWDMDMRKGGTTYSATWVKMLGYEEHELDGDPDRWLTMIHPDDREVVEEADRAHLEGKTPFFEAEFRMRHKDGRWIWILDRGKALERDESGRLIRAIGSLTDITKRKETEERLAVSVALLADEKERLRVTLDSIGDAVICTDAAMRITFMNPVAEKLTGTTEGEALGRPLEAVYAPADEESGEKIATAAALAGLKQRVEHNSRAILSTKDGSRCCIREVVSPILNDKGEFGGSVIVFQDFTDARALQRRLAHAAAHDSLTGLANRASLLAAMTALISAPRPDGPGDLFLYVDLDNFKTVNDTGGHAAGDLVLKRVAETIRATVRAGDFVARLGGDEFAVILRDCAPDTGKTMAELLVAVIAGLGFERDEMTSGLGASIGLTPIGRGETDVDAIMVRADLACYEAKANGRGSVVVLEAPAATARQSKRSFAKAS